MTTNGRLNVNIMDLPVMADGQQAELQRLLVKLEIYTESIFRTVYAGGEAVSRDEVTPLDLGRVLAGVQAGSGLLPPNILCFGQQGQARQVGLYAPPVVQPLLIMDQQSVTIPLPPLVLWGQGEVYRIFALGEEGWPDSESLLYRAPFPNVYVDDAGYICRGSVKFPEAAPATIHRALELFFESEFNQDLAGGKSRKYPDSVLRMWREVDGAEVYPVDDLVPAGLRLEDLLR